MSTLRPLAACIVSLSLLLPGAVRALGYPDKPIRLIVGFSLGLILSSVMVAFACGAILYSTSRIIHEYNTGQHVAASLSLFASVALLFWYVLRILMTLSSGGDD